MKHFILLILCSLSLTLRAQQYEIPGAQQQPAWVFPLYFEDGFGSKDTLYLGYDINARGENYGPSENPIWNPDTVFNEVFDSLTQDSVFHVNARPANDFPYQITVSVNQYAQGYRFTCNHAKLPLKIKWDGSLLYSTDLPFPDQLPLPTAEGLFWPQFDLYTIGNEFGENCGLNGAPIVWTDTTISSECAFEDSVTLNSWSCPDCFAAGAQFTLDFRQWTGMGWIGIGEQDDVEVNVYPNPATDYITVSLPQADKAILRLYDTMGRTVRTETATSPQHTMDLSELPSGIYLLNVQTSEDRSTRSYRIMKK